MALCLLIGHLLDHGQGGNWCLRFLEALRRDSRYDLHELAWLDASRLRDFDS